MEVQGLSASSRHSSEPGRAATTEDRCADQREARGTGGKGGVVFVVSVCECVCVCWVGGWGGWSSLLRWAEVHRSFVLAVSGEPVICSAGHNAFDVK